MGSIPPIIIRTIIYKGIYNPMIAITLVVVTLYMIIWLYKSKNTIEENKWKVVLVIILAILSLSIPIYTSPNIPYNAGKELIRDRIGESIELVELSFIESTVYVSKKERIFIRPKAYYYEVKSGEKNRVFILDPITIEIIEVSSD